MRVFIGSDHAGLALKHSLISQLSKEIPGLSIEDCGCAGTESSDYPIFGEETARKVVAERALGILICGTGIGIGIAANKVRGARAAMVTDVTAARLARGHNDANLVCVGARLVGEVVALDICKTFIQTPFEGGRHGRRVSLISEIEQRQ